jgi:hypothetical protein
MAPIFFLILHIVPVVLAASEPNENAATESMTTAERTGRRILEIVDRRRHSAPIAGVFVEAHKIVSVSLEHAQEVYLVVFYGRDRCSLLTLSAIMYADAKLVFDAFVDYLNNDGSLDAISAAISAVRKKQTV